MKVFLTHSTQHLRRSLEKRSCEIGQVEFYAFSDGERGYRLKESVKRKSVAIISSILPDPESFFELLALHQLILENRAKKINIFVPYLGYARQDRPSRPGEGSIGIMIAKLLQKMSSSLLILFDVHSDRIRKTFNASTRELSALPLFAEILKKEPPDVIVSPDTGFVAKARQLSKIMKPHPEIAIIEKLRPRPNVAIAKRLRGDVRGKDVVIVDDMIDTGGTLSEAIKLVFQKGAQSIRLAATHGIFSGNARDRLLRLPVEEILITNTLPQIQSPRIRILDMVPFIVNSL
jgi:ribose-phosphate pyrophosphokinase